jgi:two-component system sensor histidine kinase KdpD
MVLGITLPSLFLRPIIGERSIALIYLMGVVGIALFAGRGPTLLAAALSALAWNRFFLTPIAKTRSTSADDMVLLAAYLIVAIVLGQLTARLRARERCSRQRDERSTALYQMARELLRAMTLDELVETIVRNIENSLQAPVAVLLANGAGRLSYHTHPASTYDIAGPEQPIAEWVFENAQPAGRFTSKLAQCETLFVPLLVDDRSIGVIGLRWKESSAPDREQASLLNEWAKDIAVALRRTLLREPCEGARSKPESELA